MSIAQSILPEFDHEMASTRKLLERTPGQDAAWKPHPRSYTLGQLAMHVAMIPSWLGPTLQQTELDIAPAGEPPHTTPAFESTSAMLALLDKNVRDGRAALAAAKDPDFMVPWSLKSGGQTVFTIPRIAVVRSFVMNHHIHHRGQLTVYFRLRNVPLPAIYGPTADEG
jgi:uncharacterized damage-inducible protein DinB